MTSVIGSTILRTQSDERLVALSRTGHQRAFEAIVERYRGELTRSVRRLLPGASVEDVLQQTHLEAWKALSGGTEVRELRAWLHRIARNAAIATASRGYDYDELKDALQATPGPEADLERREAVRRALRGIAELPERQREALLAVALGGRSHAEVALDLGITEPAARQLLRRARVSLLALATVLTPPQLVRWAARAGHSLLAGKAAAGAGLGGSLTGPAVKVGAIAVTAGALAAGVAPIRHALAPPPPPPAHHHHRQARSPGAPAYLAAARKAPKAARLVSSTRPASAGPAPARRHHAHHARPVSAIPVAATVPALGAGTPVPTPAQTAPAPTTAPPAAVTPAGSSGLAALVAWAIAHRQQYSTGASQTGAPGSQTPGQPGQGQTAPPQPTGQTAAGSPGGCASSTPATTTTPSQTRWPGYTGWHWAGSGSSGCGSSGSFPWSSSGASSVPSSTH